MEDRNLHPFAQLAFHFEAFRRLDVFQIDAAKSGFQAGDDVHQLVRVGFIDFDVEHIDTGKFLEQHRLAFHYRLGGQRADIAQAQHGGAVGDDAHQIGTGGKAAGIERVGDDFFAGSSHTRGVGQRQIALGHQRLAGIDGDFARSGEFVVIQCCLTVGRIHGVAPDVGLVAVPRPSLCRFGCRQGSRFVSSRAVSRGPANWISGKSSEIT